MADGRMTVEEVEAAYVLLAEDEPDTYQDTMLSENASKWREACKVEYDTLIGYHTWTLVEAPPDTNIVGSQWSFRVK